MTTSLTKKTTMIGSAAALAAAFALSASSAAVAAEYPPGPGPGGNSESSATSVEAGGSVDFTFGVTTPFTAGTTVDVSSTCTDSNGATFEGPRTVTTADGSGLAHVSLTFTKAGECVVTATGAGANGTVTATSKITVTGTSGNYPGSSDNLAKTGSSNTLTIAVLGGGLLLAGVGAVIVARRREQNHI